MFSWGEAGVFCFGESRWFMLGSVGESYVLVRQARYGYYGSLWCGELQLKVPT